MMVKKMNNIDYEKLYWKEVEENIQLQEKIEKLEKRVAELEKEVGYIKEDIYEFVEDEEECGGHCGCGHCGGCEED